MKVFLYENLKICFVTSTYETQIVIASNPSRLTYFIRSDIYETLALWDRRDPSAVLLWWLNGKCNRDL